MYISLEFEKQMGEEIVKNIGMKIKINRGIQIQIPMLLTE